MNYLFVDTETTGFPKKGPRIQEGQARVCQLAFIYTDEDGKTLAEFSSMIRPDGWSIKEDASKIHGLTDDTCFAHGLDMRLVMEVFKRFETNANVVVAHNEEFDRGMLTIEESYLVGQEIDYIVTPWHCTMKSNEHHFGKWPKLAAALEFFTGRILGADAHDALHDVRACRDIFFAARDREVA
jgi:DNA polymerase III epsilon subunit-like protein